MRHDGYDDLLDDVVEGEGYYLECPEGHGSLPPRRVCPECGARELTEAALPDAGEILATTTVAVGTPDFDADTPYVVGIADFGPVRLTGIVRGADDEPETGASVGLDVGERADGERVLVLRPR